ncbi:MAG TPA: hypothetical protein PLV50_08685 [Smithella sp.]|nr:hypothetical protein [Smithella sp.]MDM7987503.1 hypothetical protein [Smithella sp.]HNY49618.1 hypothetical protein [Smithella sp.]HOG90601.1 hypothetical protein [Smithella sp.]HOU52054.1 hypothetical protein [Smithella sp.]
MGKRLLTLILTGAFIATTLIPLTVEARHGGKMNGQTQQIRSQSNLQIRDQQRLRDGSCINAAQKSTGTQQKKGNTYGPGDGTGNSGIGPQNGTGYGAPTNR